MKKQIASIFLFLCTASSLSAMEWLTNEDINEVAQVYWEDMQPAQALTDNEQK
jgi:hypothetical protein